MAKQKADEFPYMPIYWRDWLTGEATMFMTPEEEGCFLNLLLRAWGATPPCTLPDDPDQLAMLSKAGKRWPKVESRLMLEFEAVVDEQGRAIGRIRNPKQWRVYSAMIELREKRSKSASKRGSKTEATDTTNPEHEGGLAVAVAVANKENRSVVVRGKENGLQRVGDAIAQVLPLRPTGTTNA